LFYENLHRHPTCGHTTTYVPPHTAAIPTSPQEPITPKTPLLPTRDNPIATTPAKIPAQIPTAVPQLADVAAEIASSNAPLNQIASSLTILAEKATDNRLLEAKDQTVTYLAKEIQVLSKVLKTFAPQQSQLLEEYKTMNAHLVAFNNQMNTHTQANLAAMHGVASSNASLNQIASSLTILAEEASDNSHLEAKDQTMTYLAREVQEQ
jgi:hypothetical protein